MGRCFKEDSKYLATKLPGPADHQGKQKHSRALRWYFHLGSVAVASILAADHNSHVSSNSLGRNFCLTFQMTLLLKLLCQQNWAMREQSSWRLANTRELINVTGNFMLVNGRIDETSMTERKKVSMYVLIYIVIYRNAYYEYCTLLIYYHSLRIQQTAL